MGSSSHDLLDAIFEVEVSDEILDDMESIDVAPSPRFGAVTSYGARSPSVSPLGVRTPRGRYISGASVPNSPGFSRRSRSRNGAFLAPPDPNSPLARLFTGVRGSGEPSPLLQEDFAASMKRMESLLEQLPDVQKLRGELRDTKERLERIETLLLTLTRSAL